MAFISAIIDPNFYSVPVLLIIQPLSFIFCSVIMIVSPFPWSLIIQPFSIVNVSINMYEFPLPIGFVVVPISFVPSSIWPNLHPISLSRVPTPTSVINYAVAKPDGRFFINFLFLVLSSRSRSCIEIWFIFLCHAGTTKLKWSYYPAAATLWAWLGA